MTFIGLLFLLTCHYLIGFGFLSFFRPDLNRPARTALSFITGVAVTSLVPFMLELAKVRFSVYSVGISILALAVLLNIRNFKLIAGKFKSFSFEKIRPSFSLYEWPFMLLFSLMFIASAWRAFYYPPNARDMLSGPEAIAEYAVREGSMINSVFTINLETTNNHQKPPFVTGLQIIYKLFGFPFGQLWLSVIAIAFTVFLFQALKKEVHPLLACVLTMLLVTLPELYAYTFIILFDYSNMVLFFTGFYFLFAYFKSGEQRDFYLGALLFALATFIRLETVILIALVLPALWLNSFNRKRPLGRTILQSVVLLAAPFFFYVLWINVYLAHYMPVQFQLGSQINPNLFDFTPLVQRLKDMNTLLIFGGYGKSLWGYFMQLFTVFIALDLIIKRKITPEYRNWLYAIAVVYFGLPIIGYLLPLADLTSTTKRGLFKMLPLMVMLMANTTLLKHLSAAIFNWENAEPTPVKPTPVKPVSVKPVPATKQKNSGKRVAR